MRHRKTSTHQRLLQQFPPENPLKLVAMDILELLSKTKIGSKYVMVVTDHFSKLTRELPTGTTAAKCVARVFLNYWAIWYGIPE